MNMEEHPAMNPQSRICTRNLRRNFPTPAKKSKNNESAPRFVHHFSDPDYDDLRKNTDRNGTRPSMPPPHILFFGEGDDRSYLETIIKKG